MSTPAPTGTVAYPVAELERRFYAFVLDRLLDLGLCTVLAFVLWQVTDGASPVLVLGISGGLLLALWLVFAVLSGVAGLTPGKAALGLRLVGQESGAPIGVGKGLLRSLVLAAFGLPTFGFGLAALAWTAVADAGGQRRGWHDHLTGAVVVDVRDRPQDDVEAVDNTPRHVVNLTAMRLVPAPAVQASARRVVESDHSMRREPLAKDLSGPGTGQQPRLAPPVPPPVAPAAPVAPAVAAPAAAAGRAPVNVVPGAPTARPEASPAPAMPP
ncbi:MAG: RDD family protein, partial [Nocardioides sp.]|uniref:RDD family protein n=1 Tax=Nocardioides sp. TaxID=35761 RepID=UPI003F0570B2